MILKCAFASLFAASALFLMDSTADARALDRAESEDLIGGAVALRLSMPDEGEGDDNDESDWWAKCVADVGCKAGVEARQGYGCPGTYYIYPSNAATQCQPKTCLISCANQVASEICRDDWFWDCYYDTDPATAAKCGQGTTGKCAYQRTDNMQTAITVCTLLGVGCTPDGGTIDCGLAQSCYDID